MKLSEQCSPTPDIVMEIKRSYNRLLKRQQEAGKYLDNPEISQNEKEKHILMFRIEVLDPLNAYLGVLKDWGVGAAEEEILNGFPI